MSAKGRPFGLRKKEEEEEEKVLPHTKPPELTENVDGDVLDYRLVSAS